MPENGVTTIRYVDQATGEDIATPIEFSGLGYQKYTIENQPPVIDGYTLNQEHVPASTGYISPYAVGETFTTVVDDHISIKTTVIDKDGHIRATAYKDGERFGGTATDKILGTASNNDKMPFMVNSKSYTYENPVDMTRDEIVYYYANNEHSNSSQMNIHYVDVTNSGRTSDFISTDGSIISTVPVTGTIGESFADKIIAPAGYQILEKDELAKNGIYTVKNHDAYVYVAKDNTSDNEKYTVETGSPVDLKHGKTIAVGDEVDPKAVVVKDSNGSPVGLPAGAKVVWTAVPNTSENGKGKTGHVKVIYGAGKESEPVDVTYNVVPSDIDKNDAKATDGLTTDLNKVPDAKGAVTVTDPDKKPVTDFEAEWAKDKTPDVSKPGKSTGTVEITYPDGSKETVEVPVTVRDENGQTQADKNDPKTPGNKVEVDDPTKLTDGEKEEVKDAIKEVNPDLPKGEDGKETEITVGDDGTATITYPDGSVDTIPGKDLVEEKTDTPTPTEKTVNVVFKGVDKKYDGKPAEVTVTITDQDGKDVDVTLEAGKDYTITKQSAAKARMLLATAKPLTDAPTEVGTYHVALTEAGKQKLKDAGYTTVNETPADFTISPADTPTPTPDTKTDDEKYDPIIPGDKVKVDDPTKLTNDEKGQVEQAVKDANKDNFPEGTEVTTGNDGTTVVTYPDGTKDTIDGDKLVEPDTKTDDEKYDPIIPGDKVKVDDPTKLTNEEKDEVVKAVEDANKDDNDDSTLPDGTKITVDNDGTATVTYPDGSEDTIPGDKVVEGKTDADKNELNVPSEDDKVKVDDPTKLTDGEKEDVVKAVEDANKDKDGNSTLPDGTKITVGDNGDVTVTYPDGSKDTIPGDKVVEGKTDADKTDVTVPGTKVEVGDPTKLTDGEKGQVEEAIKDANPNLPDGTKITVADDGTATILYPDGSHKVIDGQDLVTKPGQTTADQVTPVVPGDKVTVVDPNHLTDAEKDQVKTNVEKANQNNFPAGTVVTVADDGTATITYPDGSVDQISAADLITKPTAAGQAGKGTGTTTTNGQGAPAGQGKADQAKTLPQTGNEQGSLLAASGLGMLLLGMLGLGGKRKKED
ncbi:Rib/alpha-like domain-containing protein [Limosilactobacillus ingluviei]|uniref:Rib/alpha-like domain-containing protein n=1 Tax=Limosilactobacillus ingluviei TaxID=148604 RepID=UPI00265DB221|nr:Rib/alpha-like domain-containing protein [Limosilactobacillus ingluviei]